MTTVNMIPAPAATLTEKELWEQYLPLTITQTMSIGPTVERFVPDHHLRDAGSYGLTETIAETLADDVADSDTPDDTLDLWIVDLESYVNGLKVVRDSFRMLKQVSLIMPPEPAPGASYEAIREWEKAAHAAEEDPRYRPPVTIDGQQAA